MSLGMHVSKKGRGTKSRKMNVAIAEDVKYMDTFGIDNPAVQIFVTGPKTFKETLTQEEKDSIRAYVTAHGTPLVIHGAYVDRPWSNLAGPIDNVKLELQIGAYIGATGVIVHLSAGCANDNEFRRALTSIAEVELPRPQVLWLETQAAKSSNFTYETPEKVRRLFARIESYGINNPMLKFGLCIDTAHLFACGTSFETIGTAKQWIEEVSAITLGRQPIPVMMHLNDSSSTFGSGIDRHAPILNGNIWSAYHPTTGTIPFENSGLNYILEWADSNKILTVLERDDEDLHKDLKLVHELGFYVK